MPSGNPQRTWFPEMIDLLRSEWNSDAPFSDLIELTQRLDSQLRRIRSAYGFEPVRNITNSTVPCPICGRVGPAEERRVSVRATILAASRFGIESREVTKAIERRWAKHRAEQQLDLYGQPSGTAEAAHCGQSEPAGG